MNKYIHALLNTPPKDIPSKSFGVIKKNLLSLCEKGQNKFRPSYSVYPFDKDSQLERYFSIPQEESFRVHADQIRILANSYLAHRFDLLGSGWFVVKHGAECRGLEDHKYHAGRQPDIDKHGNWLRGRINKSNLRHSQNIWKMIDSEYTPIDWHLDFISGYRWSEDTWYMDIKYGHMPGVDIKVPWELARMQHLPQFAYAYHLAKEKYSGFEKSETYSNEFRNHILDFVATNPPRYGVNWRCAMDVAIRAVNWLAAYDLLKSSGATFDDKFEKAFITSIYDHGVHIVNNLEWSPDHTSNHYLANIAGLLFISAYLPGNEEINSWLNFSIRELISETEIQFSIEGTNYEGSTNYHRLSSEMIAYSSALISGLSKQKHLSVKSFTVGSSNFLNRPKATPIKLYNHSPDQRETPLPLQHIARLERMSLFTKLISKPNKMIPQIGDNDSGRFLKLSPDYCKMDMAEVIKKYKNFKDNALLSDNNEYMLENHLDHKHITTAIDALFNDDITTDTDCFEKDLIKGLSKNKPFLSTIKVMEENHPSHIKIGTENIFEGWLNKINSLPSSQKVEHVIPAIDIKILNYYAFPIFGLFIFTNPGFYMSVRCGMKDNRAPSGHFHNDQLSIELNINGEDIIRDPGTYVYTPLPNRRNEYRSVKAHFAPRINEREPNKITNLLFRLDDQCKAKCLYFGDKGFLGMHNGYGEPIYRMVLLKSDSIIICDFTESNREIISESPFNDAIKTPYSPGYGIVQEK